MSIAKVVEITSSSPESFEDALRSGIARASRTLEGIRGAWVSEQKVVVRDERIVEYRVTMRISFLLEE